MPGSPPGPAGKSAQGSVKDQTSALTPSPSPAASFTYVNGKGVSFELKDAPSMCVPTTLSQASPDEMRVLAWLREYKMDIIAAEAEFQVDRRAVATAIAWEALENVRSASARAVGAGKEHVWRWNPRFDPMFPLQSLTNVSDEGTWVKSAEDAGLIAKQTYGARIRLLHKPDGAIRYIAATMDLIAIIYENQGTPGVCNPPIRLNPAILTNVYQGSDPEKWSERVKTIKSGEVLKPGNAMGIWFTTPRNQQLVEDGVGSPDLPDSVSDGG